MNETQEMLIKNIEDFSKNLINASMPMISNWAKLKEPIIKIIKPFIKEIEKFSEFINKVYTEGISNFESPEEYKSEKFIVNDWVETQLKTVEGPRLNKIFSEGPFSYYKERFEEAFEDYLSDKDMKLPIFIFLSIQDGLMKFLCDFVNGPNYYRYDEKFSTLISFYGDSELFVEEDLFKTNLESFYKHRHEIMHGGPNAHFDKNIATISLLFLVFTSYIVIETTI